MGSYSSSFPEDKITMTLSQLANEVASEICDSILQSKFIHDLSEVEKVCEIFRDRFYDFVVENKMDYMGSCEARVVAENIGYIFYILWSRVDIRDDLIRLDISLGEFNRKTNAFKKIGENFVKVSLFDESSVGTDIRFREGLIVKIIPTHDLSRWIARYGAYYTYLVFMYSEIFKKSISEEKFSNVIQKFIKYSTVLKSVEGTLGLKVYPDVDSAEAQFRAIFISNLCTCFSQYKTNNNVKAILFYGNTREEISPSKKCSGKVDKIIVLKNSLIVRHGVSSSNESTMKLERLLFTDFKILSKQDFKKIMFVLVLEGRWSTITGWDLGLEF